MRRQRLGLTLAGPIMACTFQPASFAWKTSGMDTPIPNATLVNRFARNG